MTKSKKRVVTRLGSVKAETRAVILGGSAEFDGSPLYRQQG